MEGGYAHGEKLPAERQLASAYGASRTTIRTALDQLEIERLVTRRVGAGTFVNFRAPGRHRGHRRAHQPAGADRGAPRHRAQYGPPGRAERHGPGHRAAGRAPIARMEPSSGDSESFTLWDEEFHQLIAEATRNPLMVWVYRQINAVRTHSQWNAMKDKVLTPGRIAEYNQQHTALYEAIRTRDIEAAVAIVTNHLHYARRQLMGANSE